METKKRVALVTGGVGGIGTAICKRIARDGHFVIANYAIPGTEAKWNRAMAAVGLNGSASALALGDVTQFDALGDMVRRIGRVHGPSDLRVDWGVIDGAAAV